MAWRKVPSDFWSDVEQTSYRWNNKNITRSVVFLHKLCKLGHWIGLYCCFYLGFVLWASIPFIWAIIHLSMSIVSKVSIFRYTPVQSVLYGTVPEYPVAQFWAPFVQKFHFDLNNNHAKFGAWLIKGNTSSVSSNLSSTLLHLPSNVAELDPETMSQVPWGTSTGPTF